MARRPNYRQERVERDRKKAARNAKKAAARAEKAAKARRDKGLPVTDAEVVPAGGESET